MTTETPVQEALRAALSPDKQVRQRGAVRLGTLADPTVAGELVALLVSEQDPFVRETLTWAVVAQPGAALPHLLAALGGTDPSRAQVLHALSKIGDPSAVEHVGPLVDDPDPAVAAKAWWVLGRTGLPASAPVLVERLGQQDDPEQRVALTRALEQLGAPAVPLVAEVLADETRPHAQRRHAAEALVAIGEPAAAALPALLEVAQGPDRELAMLALEAMAPLEDPQVDALLTGLREGESRWLSTVADWMLGDRAARRARPARGRRPRPSVGGPA